MLSLLVLIINLKPISHTSIGLQCWHFKLCSIRICPFGQLAPQFRVSCPYLSCCFSWVISQSSTPFLLCPEVLLRVPIPVFPLHSSGSFLILSTCWTSMNQAQLEHHRYLSFQTGLLIQLLELLTSMDVVLSLYQGFWKVHWTCLGFCAHFWLLLILLHFILSLTAHLTPYVQWSHVSWTKWMYLLDHLNSESDLVIPSWWHRSEISLISLNALHSVMCCL